MEYWTIFWMRIKKILRISNFLIKYWTEFMMKIFFIFLTELYKIWKNSQNNDF